MLISWMCEIVSWDSLSSEKTTAQSVKIGSWIFVLQFTASSGRHSVLKRPFSEANGRPFFS